MTENQEPIILKLTKRFWIVNVGGMFGFLILMVVLGYSYQTQRFLYISLLGGLFWLSIIYRFVKKSKKFHLIFSADKIIGEIDKQAINIHWVDIKAVKLHNSGSRKYFSLSTELEDFFIPTLYFDEDLLQANLSRLAPKEAWNEDAYHKTKNYQHRKTGKEFSQLTQKLKVSGNSAERWIGVVFLVLGFIIGIISFDGSSISDLIWIAAIFVLPSTILILFSLKWVEATNHEITIRALVREVTLDWSSIRNVYKERSSGVFALVSDSGRIIIRPNRWSGKDTDQLLNLFNYKLETMGLEPTEKYRILFWWSKYT
jgi:hypothetical protein